MKKTVQRVGIYKLENRTRRNGVKRFALEWWHKGKHHSKTFGSDKDRQNWIKARTAEAKGKLSVRAAAARAGDYVARFSRLDLEVQHALLGAWDRVELAGGGVGDVLRAADEACAALGGGITVAEAIAVHLESEAKKVRPRTYSTHRLYLEKLAATAGGRQLCTLTRGFCREWIEAASTLSAERHLHASLSAFLNDCVRRELLRDTPMHGLKKPAALTAENVAILSAEEAERVMRAAERIAPMSAARFAVALFAGLRPLRELNELRAEFVNLEDGMIYVSKGSAKTGQNRSVPIPANLRAWLEKYPFGESVPYTRHWRGKVAEEAKVALSPDIFRHTCASFRLALTRDPVRTADEMGHSPAVLRRHYANRRIPPADVERFWGIRPAGG